MMTRHLVQGDQHFFFFILRETERAQVSVSEWRRAERDNTDRIPGRFCTVSTESDWGLNSRTMRS